jgi:hypothetical protein
MTARIVFNWLIICMSRSSRIFSIAINQKLTSMHPC